MKIISRAYTEFCVEFSRSFTWRADPGAGFGFPCDEQGNVDVDKMNPAARDNYEKCLSGEFDVVDEGVQRASWSYRNPAVGRCDCGAEVELGHFTNTCDGCGQDYNSSGQELAPREQWGEETGESLGDILRIP